MSTPPKTDKFAAMAARQQQQADDATSTATKRDKFAAMTARQQQSPELPASPELADHPTAKRDKLAAMTARQTPARHDKLAHKFAAVTEQTAAEQKKQDNNDLKRKCSQRDAIWEDLDQAEQMVVQLLEIAQNTAQALATPAAPLDDLPERYQSKLQKIHSLLQPHAEHIHAYQQPTAINRIYQTRVEWRLAVEAKELLGEYKRLEENNKNETRTLKREMDDDSEQQPAKRIKR